jgi:hypothetical protein
MSYLFDKMQIRLVEIYFKVFRVLFSPILPPVEIEGLSFGDVYNESVMREPVIDGYSIRSNSSLGIISSASFPE